MVSRIAPGNHRPRATPNSARAPPSCEYGVMRLPDSDPDLLAAYQVSRSEEIFRRLVAKHSPWVLRFCHRRLHSHEDAEDATQAVFLALARRPERVQYCLVGWLVQTARRAVRDLQRSAGRRARREEVVARSRRLFAPPDN